MEHQADSKFAGPTTKVLGGIGSLGFLLDEDEADRSFSRYALLAALLLHLFFFAVNWPSFSGVVRERQKDGDILVFPITRFELPPKRPQEERAKPPAKKYPIPDPDPQAPEPIRVEEDLKWDPSDLDPRILPNIDIPAPPATDDAPVQVGSRGLQPPRLLKKVNPIYPELARKIHYEGLVILELIISKSGSVESVKVLRDEPYGLTEAAVDAAKQWLFEASTLNGRPVKIRYQLTIRFNLA